jgi:hypothetical protein
MTDRPWPPCGLTQLAWYASVMPTSGTTEPYRVVPAPPTTCTWEQPDLHLSGPLVSRVHNRDDGRREPPRDADAAKRAARKREKAARKRQRGQK